ncbi:hypothetical protein F0562_032583 [Nyssa sinensis]|uniref:Uncharacterized protein n=1 Tax=Nyssa sinensis TaxID=561372 RepID=A0A5J5AUD4_9ASTE|nr:hypothetical protein F0562_032583 [Nyssa sinensis]
MQAASLHSLPLPTRPFSGNLRRFNRRKQRPSTAVSASNRDAYDRDHYNGRIVDENMIVLRMRIREMKMAESNFGADGNEAELGIANGGVFFIQCTDIDFSSCVLFDGIFQGDSR